MHREIMFFLRKPRQNYEEHISQYTEYVFIYKSERYCNETTIHLCYVISGVQKQSQFFKLRKGFVFSFSVDIACNALK